MAKGARRRAHEAAIHREHEAVIQAERRRLARELHDSVAQELAFILGQSRQLASVLPGERGIADIASAAENALEGSRSAIYGLQMGASRDLGERVGARAHRLASRAGLELSLDVATDIAASPEVEHEIVSIVQEAVSNVARHAGATRLELSLRAENNAILLRIADDGCGFEPSRTVLPSTGGLGLSSMSERAQALGGDLRLGSRPGEGTTIELAV